MHFIFDGELAKQYGVNEAIMLQNLAFWVQKNAANNRHIHDGKAWTYNSAAAFERLFPFWSPAQIRRILASLEEQGTITSGNYNDLQLDRTKWYAVSDKCMLRICNFHLTKTANAFDENVTPIPDVNADIKPDVNIPPTSHKGDDAFDALWTQYPKRVGKPAALKAWRSLHVTALDIPRIMDGLAAHKRSEQWQRDSGQYIPHPSTWLNQRRWEGMTPDQPITIEQPRRTGFVRYGDGG